MSPDFRFSSEPVKPLLVLVETLITEFLLMESAIHSFSSNPIHHNMNNLDAVGCSIGKH